MTNYEIYYFPVQGRIESTYLLLTDQGIPFKKHIVTSEIWGKGDLKGKCAFGQLPLLQDGEFKLNQSNAILRFLGRQHGLYGKDNKEAALTDMVNDGVDDCRTKYFKFIYSDYDIGKQQYIKDLPGCLSPFEKLLQKNRNGSSFIVGDKISFADYNLFQLLQVHLVLTPDCLKDFPLLKAYVSRIASRPRIKAYLDSDEYKSRPINANGKQ
ncbi:glutathione S-transferase P-like [Protopterus annectens]|uniref:glutathione S-transferase P-like n=1 Tax=Protopterus annectens TaxID=7888 RepID=UPI001CFA9C63|nr:glutathione S-transferase P-like [Protopterus annectens]